ncbi:short-subunit dehydrogenase [Pseudosporangium ferrugineum]|uniref:Short-subunit dehydrogenase n=2 Tax=Pseudosporangium ferrugineum TaxID=439699 RepID=A0A2T0S849_9ACTN|nr:short-subunit dehydrogenase [Pseudosporangium ferrugineum]
MKKAVVTGGTGGIGLAVARSLAAAGYEVTVVGRDETRGAAAAKEIDGRFLRADLSLLTEVRALAARLAGEGPLDLLVTNVGGMWVRPWTTAEGLDGVFTLNHLSPLVLTENLVDSLAPGGRVVAVTSASIGSLPLAGELEYRETRVAGDYYGMPASGRAKLAHLAYVLDLADRLAGRGVTVLAADPRHAATPNAAEMTPEIVPPALRPHWDDIMLGVQTPPEVAADPIIWAATNPDLAGRGGLVVGLDREPADALVQPLTPALREAAALLTARTLAVALR